VIVTLPWPDKGLSPNARLHWAPKAKLKATARNEAFVQTVLALGVKGLRCNQYEGTEKLPVTITFYPPDNRLRDDDNMVGSFKAYRDGIADALGIDDRRFRPHYFFEDSAKPGKIIVELGDK